MQDWYYVKSGQQQGPVSLEQLRDMAAAGALLPNDLIWNAEMTDWVPASQISVIFPPTSATRSVDLANSTAADPNPGQDIEPGSFAIDIGATISRTFDLFKSAFAILLLQGLIYTIIVIVLSGFSSAFQAIGNIMTQNASDAGPAAAILMAVIVIIMQIIMNVVSLYLNLGLMRSCLDVCDGREITVGMLFGGLKYLLHGVLATILVGIIVFVALTPTIAIAIYTVVHLKSLTLETGLTSAFGMVICSIPAIFLSLRMTFILPGIIDRNLNCIDAIAHSFRITRGNCLRIFALWLIVGIPSAIVILLTCGLATIVFIPLLSLGITVLYRQLRYGARALQRTSP